jgi:hypothetical protein
MVFLTKNTVKELGSQVLLVILEELTDYISKKDNII